MAKIINNVTLVGGNLTKDAELKQLANGTFCSKFSIAINEKYKDNEHTSFFNITMWGKMAESLNQYLVKGQKVAVEGKLRQDRWTDNEGKARSNVEITATNIVLMGGKSESKQSENTSNFSDDVPF